jgi:uncharacterized protein (DUF488 family)
MGAESGIALRGVRALNLYTLGYEGLDVAAFIACLKRAAVRQVVDVRENPFSRKPGFSKAALAGALVAEGIEYAHVAALGCPREIRDRYKRDRDWGRYEAAFREYLDSQGAAVASVARLAREKAICLVCFEADFNRCHRSFVGQAAVALGTPAMEHLARDVAGADGQSRLFD